VVVFLLVAGVGLAADLVSKHAVFEQLLNDPIVPQRVAAIRQKLPPEAGPRQVLHYSQIHHDIAGGVKLTLSTNKGVVFGLPMNRYVVAAATVLTVGLVVLFFGTSPRRAWSTHVALGLILAGALGNLYDRLFSSVELPGCEPIRYNVRDFLDFSEWGYRYIFNVADVWLVIGVGILLLAWVLPRKKKPAEGKK
jgi:signal peptidase II